MQAQVVLGFSDRPLTHKRTAIPHLLGRFAGAWECDTFLWVTSQGKEGSVSERLLIFPGSLRALPLDCQTGISDKCAAKLEMSQEESCAEETNFAENFFPRMWHSSR